MASIVSKTNTFSSNDYLTNKYFYKKRKKDEHPTSNFSYGLVLSLSAADTIWLILCQSPNTNTEVSSRGQ